MAKRVTAPRPGTIQPEWTKHICDDCGHSSWVNSHSNLDWQGKPICLTCPFRQFHIIRGSKACANWTQRKEAKQ